MASIAAIDAQIKELYETRKRLEKEQAVAKASIALAGCETGEGVVLYCVHDLFPERAVSYHRTRAEAMTACELRNKETAYETGPPARVKPVLFFYEDAIAIAMANPSWAPLEAHQIDSTPGL